MTPLKGFEEEEEEEEEEDEEIDFNGLNVFSGGGRWGWADEWFFQWFSRGNMLSEDLYRTQSSPGVWSLHIPWPITITLVGISRITDSGDVDLTPNGKVGISIGYDFKGKGVNLYFTCFDRDLEAGI